MAPVYPNMAATSKCSKIRILHKSTGLKAVRKTAVFSIGYSGKRKKRKRIMPSNNKVKYSQIIMEIQIPRAFSLVNTLLKNAIDTKITDSKIPDKIIIKADRKDTNIKIGIPAPKIKARARLIESPANKDCQITLRFTG